MSPQISRMDSDQKLDIRLVKFYSNTFSWISPKVTPENDDQTDHTYNNDDIESILAQKRRTKKLKQAEHHQEDEWTPQWMGFQEKTEDKWLLFRNLGQLLVRRKFWHGLNFCRVTGRSSTNHAFRSTLPAMTVLVFHFVAAV